MIEEAISLWSTEKPPEHDDHESLACHYETI